jgi:ribosomal protein S18 acetylase RimI-like enzyme
LSVPGALEIERAGLKAWPGIEVEWDRAWVRRAAGGYTKRANSAQCFDPADDADVEARVEEACRWFAARGLPAVVRTNLLTAPALAAYLDASGWQRTGHSWMMAMPLERREPEPAGDILALDDPEFLSVQRHLKGMDDRTFAGFRALLGAMAVPARGIILRDADGRPVSSSLMAVADGIVVTGNVVTDPPARRRGHAAAMMRAGLAWASEAGAHTAALNVEADNPGAIALYEGLGYRRQYDYVYRVARSP